MNFCENINIKAPTKLARSTSEHDGLDVVAIHGLGVLLLEPLDDDGVQRIDGRVADGDERDAVGADLHGDADRPRHDGQAGRLRREALGIDGSEFGRGTGEEGERDGRKDWRKLLAGAGTSNLHV